LGTDPIQELEFLDDDQQKKEFLARWESALKEKAKCLQEKERIVKKWMDAFFSLTQSCSTSLRKSGLSLETISTEMQCDRQRMQLPLSRSVDSVDRTKTGERNKQ
jgi:hypothetical protein